MTRTKKPKPPSKAQIARDLAAKIDAHLQRIENDPKLNPSERYDHEKKRWVLDKWGVRDYYNAGAQAIRGPRIAVRYVSYQGTSKITLEEAAAYLTWLDAGNVGRHFEQQKKAARG